MARALRARAVWKVAQASQPALTIWESFAEGREGNEGIQSNRRFRMAQMIAVGLEVERDVPGALGSKRGASLPACLLGSNVGVVPSPRFLYFKGGSQAAKKIISVRGFLAKAITS